MSPIAVVGILGVAVLLWGVLAYNRFIRLRVWTEESWRDVYIQLQRRWDLIPNLVAAVQGYASQESDVFEQVTAARARSVDASPPREQVADTIQRSRRHYKAMVRDFDIAIQISRRDLLAGLFGFHEGQFYALTDETECTSPSVRFK